MRGGCSIRTKLTGLILAMVTIAIFLSGAVSLWGLLSMKRLSTDSSRRLGKTAAADAEAALETLAAGNLRTVAEERAGYIEEKYNEIEAYVCAIAAYAQKIYDNPNLYPDREVALPVKGSSVLAPQLLWSQKLLTEASPEGRPFLTEEILKLGNLQDMLVQYNANNDMVSSTYLATESGWMIQADYIAGSKYSRGGELPDYYEASDRQWYRIAIEADEGEIVYSDVISDVHEGYPCIVCATPVYCGDEPVAVAGTGSYLDTFNEAVLNTAIGKSGYGFLIGTGCRVMISPKTEGETAVLKGKDSDLRLGENKELAEAAKDVLGGNSGLKQITLDGRKVYLAYVPLSHLGYGFVTVMDVEEVIAPAEESRQRIMELTEQVSKDQIRTIKRIILSLVIVMAAVTFAVCVTGTVFSKRMTDPIQRLTKFVLQTDGGRLDRQICISTWDEVEELSGAFNSMTRRLRDYITNLEIITAEREKIRSEIQVASRLQEDMLPSAKEAFRDRKEFTIAAAMIPAKGVGGDFYDFFLLDEGHLAVVIADVSGKGIPAALFMVVARTVLKSNLIKMRYKDNKPVLARAVTEINNLLCADNKNGMFVTAWIGVLDCRTGQIDYVNAGHCRPLVCRKEGDCICDTFYSGFILAGIEDTQYRQGCLRLRREDTLVLYTDGVTEAADKTMKLYREEGLMAAAGRFLRQNPKGEMAQGLLNTIWRDVEEFQTGMEQADDITILTLSYHGPEFITRTAAGKKCLGLMEFLEAELLRNQISPGTRAVVLMAADEILSNIYRYSGAAEVTAGIHAGKKAAGKPRTVILLFEDDGAAYNPLEKADPDVSGPPEQRKEGGLGIYLVKKRTDWMEYTYQNGRNCLTVTKQEE